MSHLHPLASQVLPFCSKYPAQGAALYQAFIDLSLTQAWEDVKVVELPECRCALLSGKAKKGAAESMVYPTALGAPTTLEQFSKIFKAIAARLDSPPAPTVAVPPTSSSTPAASTSPSGHAATLLLAIAEKDSTVVYYVLRDGIVSPKEVPE